MIISKLLMGTTVVGFLAAGALYLLYERANAQADAARMRAASAEAAMTQIEDLFEDQRKTLEDFRNVLTAQQETMDDYFEQISSVERELSTAQLEIQKLRAVELNRAISDPFARGDVARDRLNRIVRRIGDQRDSPPSGSAADPSNAGAEPN